MPAAPASWRSAGAMPRSTRRGGPSKGGGSSRGGAGGSSQGGGRSKRSRAALAEDIDSGDSGDEEARTHAEVMANEDEEEEDDETAEERRVRLAREMLTAMDAAAAKRDDTGADAWAHDRIADQLNEDALMQRGQFRVALAAGLRATSAPFGPDAVRLYRGPRLSTTCVAIAPDETFAACGCKDGAVVRWDLATGQRTKLGGGRAAAHAAAAEGGGGEASAGGKRRAKLTGVGNTGHTSDVLSIAVSANGQLLATGGRDSAMLLWDVRTNEVVQRLGRHRGAVTSLATRRGGAGEELYSGSSDRTAKVWDLEQRGYLETLYGHQEAITALDALVEAQMLSASEDRTLRLWKIADETQLLFANGHSAPIDACALLHSEAFVSGSQDGGLALWNTNRKRPIAKKAAAHGTAPWGGPCWVSALASLPYSDVAISGSCDGHVRFWGCDDEARQMSEVASVALPGFVNGLALSKSGKLLGAALGQEHRLGRWFKLPEAKNGLAIVRLPKALHAKTRLAEASRVEAAQLARRAERPSGASDSEEEEDEEEDDDEEEEEEEEEDDESVSL